MLWGQLGDHVRPQILAQYGDSARPPVADSFQPSGGHNQPPIRNRTRTHGGVGEHVLNVEHERCPTKQPDDPARQSKRQWRRHCQDGIRFAEPSARPQPGDPSQDRKSGESEGPPKEVAFVVARERIHPGDRAPTGRLGANRAADPGGFDPVLAVPGQRRDYVKFVAERRQFMHDPSHHRSGRGGIRLEVGAENHDFHDAARRYAVASARPDAWSVNA